eukprot:CAMPEP_0172305562 /NCGR_PEP_ID=MMETSP1058-20130122/6819_1 /TAXON_ID=83371 /ORGANISM="Detonula confervacea, Strain CCMP 353" /LENGTH=326 /DNA_ID=CAMNT_0013017191 /DNA_START=70 /DNA_END=1050 /DNA_ORIENTATION=-
MQLWLFGFIIIRLGVIFYDHLVVLLIEKCFKSKVLPTREPGAPPVRYVSLDTRSFVFLFLNACNEYQFVMRLTYYLWQGGHHQSMTWKLTEMTLWNTIIALGIMFASMDMLYAPLHHLMHLPTLYPLIHKHHHRQHYPTRGYLDAGNEHPIEHMVGVLCTWFAVCSSEVLLPTCGMWLERLKEYAMSGTWESGDTMTWTQGGGVHALTVMVFFQLHAALACLNHSPYNVKFSLPFIGSASLFGAENKVLQRLDDMTFVGKLLKRIITGQWFNYSVGHHEMHHRKFNYNYGQYCMFYDRWMGTFLAYEGPMSTAELEARKKNKLKEK